MWKKVIYRGASQIAGRAGGRRGRRRNDPAAVAAVEVVNK